MPALFDGVLERADAVDSDLDHVSAVQGEGVGWDDSSSREQKAAVGKGVVAEEILDQCGWVAFQFG